MPTASLVLSFAVPAKERVKAFTPSMELASIVLLTEEKRRKRGLLKTAPKKTSLLSKLYYPFWAVPWENESLIIDGLAALSSTLTLQVLPDIAAFIDDIERGESVRKQFIAALEKHEKTFRDFAKVNEAQIDALITDTDLLSNIYEYVKETLSSDLEAKETVVLAPPKLDQQAAIELCNHVSNLFKQGQSDIKGLEYVRNLLDEAAKFHEQMILKEAESIRETYETETSKFRPEVEKRIEQLLKERDARIAKMTRVTENELKVRERELEKRERELQRLELSRSDFLKRRESRKRREDKIGVTHWEHRIRVLENKIEEVRIRIHALSEFIEKTRRQNESDVEKLRYGYQTPIDQERRKISDLEAERDRKVEARQGEIGGFKLAAQRILDQINALIERKREQEEQLKKLAVPLQFEEVTLICLPFYFVYYQTGRKTQFQIFPPFRVLSADGIVKTLQKTLSTLRPSSRMKLFLQPRSKLLGKMLDFVFEEKVKSDKAFSESLLQAAASSNVLERQNFKETLMKGVEELKAEGWISQSRGDALIKAYH